MIIRIWRGWTLPHDAEAYVAYIQETGLAEYRSTPGNQGAYLVSREDGDRTEFLTISFWDSMAAVVAFAGEDVERAVYYPDDERFLIDHEDTVRHYTLH